MAETVDEDQPIAVAAKHKAAFLLTVLQYVKTSTALLQAVVATATVRGTHTSNLTSKRRCVSGCSDTALVRQVCCEPE